MKHFFLSFFAFVYSLCLFSQNGSPYISHFKEGIDFETKNWSICQDNFNVMLFANRKGIMSFDGNNWHINKLSSIPVTIKKNPFNHKVYVGTQNGYGFLKRNKKGDIEYNNLSIDSLSTGVISDIHFTDSCIYFYGENHISCYFPGFPEKCKFWYANKGQYFTGMFFNDKNVFINVSDKGLHRLEKDTLFPLVTGFYTQKNEILFSLPYSKKRVLLGLDNGNLYTFDGIKFYKYSIDDNGYLKESILSDGLLIADSIYAFSTLYGGVEVIDKKNKKLLYTLNYDNGLPDDEVYSFGLDNNNGLWLAHEFGLSRVDFSLPVNNFTHYPGLKGNLMTSLVHDKKLFVATSEGVFYLDEVKDYNEVSIRVKTKTEKNTTSIEKKNVEVIEDKKPSRRLFFNLFKKEKEEKKEVKEEDNNKQVNTPSPKQKYVRKTVSRLKSINYIYKKIGDINTKCTQLVSTQNGLLVAGNNGLYAINNFKAKRIIDDKNILKIYKSPDKKYYVGTQTGIYLIYKKNNEWVKNAEVANFIDPAYSINLHDKNLWIGSDNFARCYFSDSKNYRDFTVKTDFPEEYHLDIVNDTLFLFLESGVFYFDADKNLFTPHEYFKKNSEGLRFILNQQGTPWIFSNGLYININKQKEIKEIKSLKLFENISSIDFNNNDIWLIQESEELYKLPVNRNLKPGNFDLFLNTVSNDKDDFFSFSKLVFSPQSKTIHINVIAPFYVKNNYVKYQYYIEETMQDWSKWTFNNDIDLMVSSGNYTLHIRALNIWGDVSPEKTVRFKVKAPFTESIWFYGLIWLVIVFLFFVISKLRERKYLKDKIILETRVKERTIEIEKQKKEIEKQRDKIIFQHDEILRQKEDITDSINYASRIQSAVLPMDDHFEKAFDDSFVLLKPRNIVSGDFYWIAEDDNKIYFTASDCTGHGVPGAFMSMLGIASLNEIFANRNGDFTAGSVLTLLREKVKAALKQTGKEGENKDGMDMAFCIFDKERYILEYAGAYNPLYLIRDNQLIEYKADRMPIGIYYIEKDGFKNNIIEIEKGDVIYIFSDGYVDQFGGPYQTKFKTDNLKYLLLDIHTKPMKEQKLIMEEKFEEWKGDLSQIDDVLFVGIKL